MSAIRHPNVVLFMGLCLEPPCIVTEFCARGSLYDVLKKARSTPAFAQQLDWSRRLSMALDAAKVVCLPCLALLARPGLLCPRACFCPGLPCPHSLHGQFLPRPALNPFTTPSFPSPTQPSFSSLPWPSLPYPGLLGPVQPFLPCPVMICSAQLSPAFNFAGAVMCTAEPARRC